MTIILFFLSYLAYVMVDQPRRRFNLGRAEKLKSRKAIGALFEKGKSTHVYPIRAFYRIVENDSISDCGASTLVAFVATKRMYKRAVDRNRIKRLMREAYRLNKHNLIQQLSQDRLHLLLLYTGKEILTQKQISIATTKLLIRLVKEINPKV